VTTPIWILDWHFVAKADLRAIPWPLAASVDAAVIRFAETGEGVVARVAPTDPRRLALRVPGAVALLYADETTQILRVARVFRVRWP
jgi:hypothetical protein